MAVLLSALLEDALHAPTASPAACQAVRAAPHPAAAPLLLQHQTSSSDWQCLPAQLPSTRRSPVVVPAAAAVAAGAISSTHSNLQRPAAAAASAQASMAIGCAPAAAPSISP